MLIVHLFVIYAHVNLCYFFSSSCVRGWLRLLLVALPGLFCLPFSFGTLGREYVNQTEMIQYRVIRYIFNDYNLRRNRQADESQYDTSMMNIFARPIKTPDS